MPLRARMAARSFTLHVGVHTNHLPSGSQSAERFLDIRRNAHPPGCDPSGLPGSRLTGLSGCDASGRGPTAIAISRALRHPGALPTADRGFPALRHPGALPAADRGFPALRHPGALPAAIAGRGAPGLPSG